MPTNDDLLFADHAVKAGFVSREEIEASLSVQKRMEEMGVKDSLRNVLVNRGALREGDAALVSKAAGLAPGRDPIPGFTLESRLGAGAMGSVYKAFQRGMQRHVAVKILRRDLTADPRQVERLRREAALVGKLDHPHIVRGLDSGETNGLVWFAMEYVDGETLRERIRRGGRIPADEAIVIARQLAEALEHAASQGIVHRDIKPGNVLLTKQGMPRLADYGLAKGQTDDALTAIDATLGTPQYVAPEQARNPRDADIRSDIYSLGATLYAMLTGRPPFEGETLAQTLTKVLYERPRPIHDLVPDLPDEVVYLVERMMAKDRRHRYPTPAALLHDLRAFEAGRLKVPAGFEGDIATYVERWRSRRLWITGASVVAGAVLMGALALWWEGETATRERAERGMAEFADTQSLPGPEPSWDGRTVAEMIRRLDRVRAEFVGTEAADAATAEIARWRKQERELGRVQELARRADRSDAEWPTIIQQLEERKRALAGETDAGVAMRQSAVTLDALLERRESRAKRDVEALRSDTSAKTLDEAARGWASLASALRSRYLAGAEPPQAKAAAVTAGQFEAAAARISAMFAPWDAASARGGALDRGAFADAASVLAAIDAEFAADTDLVALLAGLPPAGRWTAAFTARRDAAGAALAEGAQRALAALESDVLRMLGRKAFADAASRVDTFAAAALPMQADAVADLRSRVDAERDAEVAGSRDATVAASLLFFDAYGRLDATRAAQVLDELQNTLAARAVSDAQGTAFLEGARRLLVLTEQRIWDRFRGAVTQFALAGGELSDRRTGIRYRGITSVRVGRSELAFTYGQGQVWQGALADVPLDDVIRAAGVPLDDPESALAAAALRITQYHVPQDARRGLPVLSGVGPWLDAARGAAGTMPVVERLVALRDEQFRRTQHEVDDAESTARRVHEAALQELLDGRADLAMEGLRSLRDLPRLRQTEYAVSRRDEIRQQLDRAEHARQSGSIAARFPGSRFTESADGTAEIYYDFEDPAVSKPDALAALGLVSGRVEIGSRLLVIADRPARVGRAPLALGAEGAGVKLDHVASWLSADEQGAPRDAPLRMECPFLPRKRIEVSFLCRSERPFFLSVSVCGATAGVLSAPDFVQGGRGVSIWSATDIDQPDRAFDERTRKTWIDAHPDPFRREADTRFFQFEPGRVHRVRVVKDEKRTQLFVDGKLRVEEPVRFQPQPGGAAGPPSPLLDRVVISTHGPLDMDDLRIAGTLDPEWLRRR
ncbi:MAG: protein kinase [Planctomycetes bacterium]|nr:protein kinase [Planctomycetota bacterium]